MPHNKITIIFTFLLLCKNNVQFATPKIHFTIKDQLINCSKSTLIIEQTKKYNALKNCYEKIEAITGKNDLEIYKAETIIKDLKPGLYHPNILFGLVDLEKEIRLPSSLLIIPHKNDLSHTLNYIYNPPRCLTLCLWPQQKNVKPYIKQIREYVQNRELRVHFILSTQSLIKRSDRKERTQKTELLRNSIHETLSDLFRYNNAEVALSKKGYPDGVNDTILQFLGHPFDEV